MQRILLGVVWVFAWAGVALLIDDYQRRNGHPRGLHDRLRRFEPRSVADEAQEWLQGEPTV